VTTRNEYCDCRWCLDEHPGGLVLFVTLPSNDYASNTKNQNVYDYPPEEEYVEPWFPDEEGDVAGQMFVAEPVKRRLVKEFPWPAWLLPNMDRHTFGRLMIPPGGFDGRDIKEVVEARIPWACDNGSFNVFDQPRFEQMMDRLAHKPFCHFVAAPDVVWNKFKVKDRHLSAIQTIERFLEWQPFIKERGLPAAMVAQDHLERYDADIPWDKIDAWFVGGSDAWKTSEASEHYIREARRRELWVHVGRVSSVERIRWCRTVGASSFDGSAYGRFRDSHDKRDGLGRLQAGLINAAAPIEDRHTVLNGHEDMTPNKEKERSNALPQP